MGDAPFVADVLTARLGNFDFHSLVLGGKVDTEWADKLIGGIRALTCHSYKNQSLWKAKTGKTFKSVNAVRR